MKWNFSYFSIFPMFYSMCSLNYRQIFIYIKNTYTCIYYIYWHKYIRIYILVQWKEEPPFWVKIIAHSSIKMLQFKINATKWMLSNIFPTYLFEHKHIHTYTPTYSTYSCINTLRSIQNIQLFTVFYKMLSTYTLTPTNVRNIFLSSL